VKIIPQLPSQDSTLPLPEPNQKLIDGLTTRRSAKIASLRNAKAPSNEELREILKVAIRVPDHGKTVPWRIIVIAGENRGILGQKLADVAFVKNPKIDAEQYNIEKERLERAPLVIALLHTPKANPKATLWEQELSTGALGLSLLLALQGYGYSACWLSEWPIYDEAAAKIIGAKDNEKIAGLFYVGKTQIAATERPRPNVSDIVEYWNES